MEYTYRVHYRRIHDHLCMYIDSYAYDIEDSYESLDEDDSLDTDRWPIVYAAITVAGRCAHCFGYDKKKEMESIRDLVDGKSTLNYVTTKLGITVGDLPEVMKTTSVFNIADAASDVFDSKKDIKDVLTYAKKRLGLYGYVAYLYVSLDSVILNRSCIEGYVEDESDKVCQAHEVLRKILNRVNGYSIKVEMERAESVLANNIPIYAVTKLGVKSFGDVL